MKEGMAVPDSETPRAPGIGDVPESWGFHLLQELRRMEDKMDARFEATDTKLEDKIEALNVKLDTKFEALDAKFDAKIEALDTKFDAKIEALGAKFDVKLDRLENTFTQEVRGLRYWSWGAILTVVAGAVATILTVLLH